MFIVIIAHFVAAVPLCTFAVNAISDHDLHNVKINFKKVYCRTYLSSCTPTIQFDVCNNKIRVVLINTIL